MFSAKINKKNLKPQVAPDELRAYSYSHVSHEAEESNGEDALYTSQLGISATKGNESAQRGSAK
jgi:hypothetical protein